MTEAFTKIPWDRSTSFPGEEEKKEEIGAETGSIAYEALLGLGLSYSSSAAPTKNEDDESAIKVDDESAIKVDDESTFKVDDESAFKVDDESAFKMDDESAFKTDDESSALPVKIDDYSVDITEKLDDGASELLAKKESDSDEELAKIKDDSSEESAVAVDDDSELQNDFDEALDARLKELDEASASVHSTSRLRDDDEEEEVTEEAVDDDLDVDLALARSQSAMDSAVESVLESALESAVAEDASTSASKSGASSVASSKEQDASSESSKKSDSESVTSTSGPTDQESEVRTEEEPPTKSLRPPLFPRRPRSNSSSLRKNMKPGIASFFRSRSNPTKPDKSDRSVEDGLTTVSLDGRIGTQREAPSDNGSVAGRSVASVPSCSEDTVEVIAVDPNASENELDGTETELEATETETEVEPEKVEASEKNTTPEELADVLSDAGDTATAIGVVKDASSDADMFAKTVNRIHAKMSSGSNEIQDPWPNPWADTGTALAEMHAELHAAPGLARNPHIVNNDDGGADSVLEGVVGVVLSAGVSAPAATEDANHGAELAGADDILPNPAALNPDLVKASLAEEFKSDSSQAEEMGEEVVDPNGDQGSASDDTESGADKNQEDDAKKDWQELLTSEDASSEGGSPNSKGDGKSKPRRQSSLWKRTKSMVKTRRTSHKNMFQAGQAAKKEAAKEEAAKKEAAKKERFKKVVEAGNKEAEEPTKKPKGHKFKLGYLCLFNPCGNKKLSTIKEIDEGNDTVNKAAGETTVDAVSDPTAVAQEIDEQEESEQATDEMDETYDDLVDILDYDASTARQPAAEGMPVVNLVHEQNAMPTENAVRVGEDSKVEETKSDLIQLDLAGSKQNSRSWLTAELPSMESNAMMGRDPKRTFSDVSTIGDMSDGAAGPNMISSINFYINAASKAMQHNLYEVPVRELEKLRDMTCGSGVEEHSSLFDKGLTQTESDSIKCNNKKQGAAKSKQSPNMLSIAVRELIDVLECGPSPTTKKPTKSVSKKFEEAKVEMLGSTSVA